MTRQSQSFHDFIYQLRDACRTDDVAAVANLVAIASSKSDLSFKAQDVLDRGLRYTPLNNAIKVLAYLVEQGADFNSLQGWRLVSGADGKLPSRELLEFLLAQGWDINSGEPSFYRAPLLWKVMEDHELVKWCLDHGASVHLPHSDSEDDRAMRRPILLIATRYGNLSTFEVLRSRSVPLCPEILPEAVTMGVHAAPDVGETPDECF